MTCTTATAPINISKDSIDDNCSLKCHYKYDYPVTPSAPISNEGNYLVISYDNAKIKFNDNELLTNSIRIYTPSMHTFNGLSSDGEIIISHVGAGYSLLVCIPIVISSGKSEGSKELESIIKFASEHVPNVGEKSSYVSSTFTLNSFIPKKKSFYSYNGTLPYSPCNGNHNYVVFMPSDSSVFISSENMNELQKMIIKHDSVIKKTNSVFYNKKGAIYDGGVTSLEDDDIYIDCRPTGEDGEVVPIPTCNSNKKPTNTESFDFSNPAVIVLVSLLGGILLFILIHSAIAIYKSIRGQS
jgi:carbonic anhydrase